MFTADVWLRVFDSLTLNDILAFVLSHKEAYDCQLYWRYLCSRKSQLSMDEFPHCDYRAIYPQLLQRPSKALVHLAAVKKVAQLRFQVDEQLPWFEEGEQIISVLLKEPLINSKDDQARYDIFKQEKYKLVEAKCIYYEVEILSEPNAPPGVDALSSVVAIGLHWSQATENDFQLQGAHIGWKKQGVGFHSDDACVFFNSNYWSTGFEGPFRKGDVIGFGLQLSDFEMFCTHNGKALRINPDDIVDIADKIVGNNIFAVVSARENTTFELNFGYKPFRYSGDIEDTLMTLFLDDSDSDWEDDDSADLPDQSDDSFF